MLQPMTYIDMGVSKNGGTQQPLVFLLKMVIFGCFGGTTIYGNTHMVDLWLFMLFALTLTLVCHLQYSTSMSISWLKCTIPCNTVAHVDGHVSTSCGCPEHLPEECPVKKSTYWCLQLQVFLCTEQPNGQLFAMYGVVYPDNPTGVALTQVRFVSVCRHLLDWHKNHPAYILVWSYFHHPLCLKQFRLFLVFFWFPQHYVSMIFHTFQSTVANGRML